MTDTLTNGLPVATTMQTRPTPTTTMEATTRAIKDTNKMTTMTANTMIRELQDSNTKVNVNHAAATIPRKIQRHLATSP